MNSGTTRPVVKEAWRLNWGVDGKKPQTWSFHWILQTATKKYQAEKTTESHRKPSKSYSRLGSFQQEPKEATKPTPSPPEGWLIKVDLQCHLI